ncbi:hypothetical protein DFH06DRAFT_719172 [Mycena polygramma]|nr:hypothetical protein DFH06DRAFT_719172 [Mycena polygramma]
MHHLRLLSCIIAVLLFGLQADAQDGNLLRNPTFQTSGDASIPDDWSLHGDGFASALGGTTTQAMALKSIDSNAPSMLLQNISTQSAINYQLSFDAFASDADKGQQNLTVSIGVGTWSVHPPGQWQLYTFATRGKGSDDVLKFSAVDTSGGSVYVYNLAMVSLGADNSPSATPSVSASSAQSPFPSGGPSVLLVAGSSDSSLSKGALIATIISPIVTLLGMILAWRKWDDVKSCCSGRRDGHATSPTASHPGDTAKFRADSVEDLPLVSYA